jgi:phage regulator Rha-like protein
LSLKAIVEGARYTGYSGFFYLKGEKMELMNLNKSQTMSSIEIADLVESRHDSVKRSIERLMKLNAISNTPLVDGIKSANGVIQSVYYIGKRDSIIIVAQLCPQFTARLVDRWQQLEAEKQSATMMMPNFSNPAEAARAWALQYESAQLAISTKSEIGNRREATAMNTASQAVKKANKLEIELDRSKDYATIKRMQLQYHGVAFNWRLLKSAAQDLGIEPIDTFDQNYGSVKAYHREVWLEAYALSID